MTWLRILIHRLRGLFLTRRLERELDEEIRSHLDLQIEENQRQGMSPNEAQSAALCKFGGVEQIKEVYRDRRGLPLVETTLQDLRYGLRMMLKHKVFTAVAALSLALGIGANTAIFSMLDALLLKTLPVKNPEQLVFVGGLEYQYPPQSDRALHNIPVPDPVYLEMSEKNTVFSGIFTYNWVEATVNDGSLAERVSGQLVSGNFFTVMGVGAHLGRIFSDDDDRTPGAHFVTVISYDYWRRPKHRRQEDQHQYSPLHHHQM